MAKIIGIHGIAQTYTGAETLSTSWYNAMIDGFRLSGYKHSCKADFDMVFYGDIFRPTATTRSSNVTIGENIDGYWKTEQLRAWWTEARRLSELSNGNEKEESKLIQAPDIDTRARTPQFVQRALIQLSKTKFFKSLSSRDIIATIHQVWAFLHDKEIKDQILKRVQNAITDDTKIIIGHSLGSVVAYEAICKTGLELDAFITIGSPLGIKNLVFDKLTPCPVNGKGYRPATVKNWINIADEGDIVALEKRLAPLFDNVSDVMVYNGWHAHDVCRYLSSRILGETLAKLETV